jgi:hypothetical protein
MLTREEKALKQLLQIFIFLFAVAGLAFGIVPRMIVSQLNLLAAKISPQLPTLSVTDNRFWVALTVSMMATITALCYGAQTDIRRKKELVAYVLVAKAFSTLFFMLYFLFDGYALAYLFGSLVDGPIFLILWTFYRRAARSSQLSL